MEVIILAGGRGTRLRSVVKGVPKPMADINGVPFLRYLLDYLLNYSVTRVILSVGYRQNVIQDYFGTAYKSIHIVYALEDSPLGTGGAIKKAMKQVEGEQVFVLNGDTFFDINLHEFEAFSQNIPYDILLSLKEMYEVKRYGSVVLENNKVRSFQEKQYYPKAIVNGGIYLIKKNLFDSVEEDQFSFENFMESQTTTLNINGFLCNESYFIDIGIPEDYEKAKTDFKVKFG